MKDSSFTWRELKRLQTMRRLLLHPIPHPLPIISRQNKWKTTQPARKQKKILRYATTDCKRNISFTDSLSRDWVLHVSLLHPSRVKFDPSEPDWAHECPLKRSEGYQLTKCFTASVLPLLGNFWRLGWICTTIFSFSGIPPFRGEQMSTTRSSCRRLCAIFFISTASASTFSKK